VGLVRQRAAPLSERPCKCFSNFEFVFCGRMFPIPFDGADDLLESCLVLIFNVEVELDTQANGATAWFLGEGTQSDLVRWLIAATKLHHALLQQSSLKSAQHTPDASCSSVPSSGT
jgi:hypothetical protein